MLDNAKQLLARIKASLAKLPNAYVAADAWALRKAAGVLAKGAKDAARFAGQVKDDISKDLSTLARDAWSVSVGPLLLLAGAAYLMSGESASQSDPLTLAGLAYLATRVL